VDARRQPRDLQLVRRRSQRGGSIAQVHGFEVAGGTPALVMEIVEGEDLADRIRRGPVPIEDAVAIARQVAAALEAAHESLIVHRDLKPANIKVRPDGTVKVLDFGLAKALDPMEAGRAAAAATFVEAATITTPAMTRAGIILGTAAYMAPEQAKGKPLDRRADIWAFGVVLYEMLTGRAAFDGETVTEVLAAVITQDADLSRLPAETPPALRQLLARCLQKDPRVRLRDIGEARILLEGPLDPPASVAPATAPAAAPSRARRPGTLAAAAALLALAAVPAGFLLLRTPPAQVIRASLELPPGLELQQAMSQPMAVAVSPDGSTIAFVAVPTSDRTADASLYVRRLDRADAAAVPESEGARLAFFSPDSRWVGFISRGVLRKVSLSGGAPVTLAGGIANAWGATWLPDGRILYSDPQTTGEMLFAVPDTGGAPALVSRTDRLDMDHSFPAPLAPGALLVTQWTGGLYATARIGTFSLDTNSVDTVLIDGGSHGHVVGRHLVYARGDELLAVPFDVGRRALAGTPVGVVSGVMTDVRYATPHFDVSPSGLLAYVPRPARATLPQIAWVTRDGAVEPIVEDEYVDHVGTRLSPDGRHVVFPSLSDNRDIDLWAYDIVTRRRVRLTSARGEEYEARFWPDSRSVLFAAWRGTGGMYRVPLVGGTEQPLRFAPGTPTLRPQSVSPDGRWLIVSEDLEASGDIGVVDLASEPHTLRWVLDSGFRERGGYVSPTGRHLAFESDQLGRPDVWVAPFADGQLGAPVPVSQHGGTQAFWSTDGRTLYFTSGPTLFGAAVSEAGPRVEVSVPRAVLEMTDTRVFGVAPDGRFVGVRREHSPITRIQVIVNWHEELARLGK
jgi:eukaryotic-like serine/threonine-protein kinase